MKNWIERHLSKNEIEQISRIVQETEMQTDGEIVPIIVRRSSAIGHVKWILTAFLTLIFIICETFYIGNHWDRHNMWWPPLAFILFFFISGFLARIDWFQRVLTPNEDEVTQVHARAELEFFRSHLRKTARQTGILIFVSVMERRVVVLADEGIAAHYPQETWDEVVGLMTSEFKKGQVFLGFEKAIKRCGEILKAKLPATHSANELANHLIIKD